MPTKGKVDRVGFFEGAGRKLDQGVGWIGEKVRCAREAYRGLNADYAKRVQQGKILRVLPPSLILLVLTFILLPFLAAQVFHNDMSLWEGRDGTPLIPGETIYHDEVDQEITVLNGWSKVSSISVVFGTHGRANHATYEFVVTEDGKPIYSEEFSTVGIKDNDYHRFDFATPLRMDTDKNYSFTIRGLETTDHDAVAVYRSATTNDIIYRIGGASYFYTMVVVCATIFLIVYFVMNILINSKLIRSDLRFMAYMLIYIIPLVFMIPAYTIPDEPYHFLSAVRLAQYDWAKTPADNASNMEYNLPSNSGCISTYFVNIKTPGEVTPERLLDCFKSAPNEKGTYLAAPTTSHFIAYLPATIGVMFGDLVSDSPMVIYYAGRVFNLITVSAIIVFAMSLVKKHRLALLSVIFIPMFLQQAISYSYDGPLNALCILVLAYAIRFLTTDAKVRARDVAILAVAIAFIGIIKLPYIIIAAPLLFIKNEKFGKRKILKWAIGALLLAFAIVPHVIDSQIQQIGAPPSAVVDENARGLPASSLLNVRSTAKFFLRTLYVQTPFYLTSLIGFFGWFYFKLDILIIVLYFGFLLAVVMADEEVRFSKGARIASFLAACAISVACFLAMYLGWTYPTDMVIEGVQGRYFLPVLPLLMIAFMPEHAKIELPRKTAYAFFNLITLCFIVTLLVGFY